MYVYLHILGLLFAVVSASANNFIDTNVKGLHNSYGACSSQTSNDVLKIQAIEAAFGKSNITDVVFVIDRSKSMSSNAFITTKKAITMLMDYLMNSRQVYFHPLYTRVSIASFGEKCMVEFDGINSDPGAVHSCNFDDKLKTIKLGTTGRDHTNLAAALKVAEKMFVSSMRNEANKILWVFTDGKTDCSSNVGKLREHKITVFTAGVGEQLNSRMREQTVASLAQDTHHYACATQWMAITRNATKHTNRVVSRRKESALLMADDTYKGGKCSSCPGQQRCFCSVFERHYICATIAQRHHEDVYARSRRVTRGTGDNDTTTSTMSAFPMLIIFILLGAVAVVVFLLCMDFCFACFRRHCVHNVRPNHTDSVWVKHESTDIGTRPPKDIDGDNGNVQHNGISNDHQNGPSWFQKLVINTAQTNNLKGLLVYDTENVCTRAAIYLLRLLPTEIHSLQEVLLAGDYSKDYVDVAGTSYAVDYTNLEDLLLHGKSAGGDHLWVAMHDNVIIVGVAGPDKNVACKNAVTDLQNDRYYREELKTVF